MNFSMKTYFSRSSLLILVITAIMTPHQAWSADTPEKERPLIYDEFLDGSKQIADALKIAKAENKHVLLQFGANWCGWCHLLHNLFATNEVINKKLKSNYVFVMIDVNKGHNKEIDTKYGNPMRFGLPVLVVLDSDGTQLTTRSTGQLEKGKQHDPDKVLAFLEKWSPKKPE